MDESLHSRFQEKLDNFIFFHLGSDTRAEVVFGPQEVTVRLDHRRIHPFTFKISETKVAELLEDPEQFETFLLTYLTSHRRS